MEIALYNFKGYCFKVDMAHQGWLFCDETTPPLMDFKKTLIATIIKAWYKVNLPGMPVPTGISESQCASIPFSWASGSQSEWVCKCNKPTSKSQSPIAMGTKMPDVKNADDD